MFRYTIPSQTKAFVQKKLSTQIEAEIKDYWLQYYLNFVRKNVIREEPDEPYWNALVSDKMKALKKEWSGINEVLNWAKDDPKYNRVFIDLVSLLVHYLDSRFYNQDRLVFVEAAIKAAENLGLLYEEALFRIDALGWTYVEESALDKAKEQIVLGLQKAEQLNGVDAVRAADLLALGNAWLARVEIENNNSNEAFAAINKALTYNGKSWINYRVHMAAGDVYVHEKDFKKALSYYEKAKEEYNSYGGEGHDYQINPRIGLAYLRNNMVKEAEVIFNAQKDEDIPIGTLYAEYGLALIAHRYGNKQEAIKKLNEIEKEICTRTSSNILLKLIKAFRIEQET